MAKRKFIVPVDFPIREFAGKHFLNRETAQKAIAEYVKKHNRVVSGKTLRDATPSMPVSSGNIQFRKAAFKTYSEAQYGPKDAERVQAKTTQGAYGVNTLNKHAIAAVKAESVKRARQIEKERKSRNLNNNQKAWVESDPYAKVKAQSAKV